MPTNPPTANLYVDPTVADMNALLGKTISEICLCEFHGADFNHCAHFVSHVMKYQFGYTCFAQTGKGEAENKANIRVQEVFPQCRTVGRWDAKPATITAGLVFITAASNVDLANKTMVNVPRKHIGIFIETTIWHYSNTRDQVVSQTPDQFSHHYSGRDITMFYGEFPV
jgi:hypothetical protein